MAKVRYVKGHFVLFGLKIVRYVRKYVTYESVLDRVKCREIYQFVLGTLEKVCYTRMSVTYRVRYVDVLL